MSYIYHYTTLPSLVSIIGNRQLKLTRLDKFNELYEPKTFVREGFNNIFISSWTKDDSESINIWKILSNLEIGIRIGINTETAFSSSGLLNVSINPVSPIGIGAYFRIKSPTNELRIVDVIECEDCQKEISDILDSEDYDLTIEEFRKKCDRKSKIPFLTSNSLVSNNEVRLITSLVEPKQPNNKKALLEYSRNINIDNQFEFIIANLPKSFFDGMRVVVSPDFSETNFIILNAFLSNLGFHQAIKSDLTFLYQSHKTANTLIKFL